jgi:hypothetical protein
MRPEADREERTRAEIRSRKKAAEVPSRALSLNVREEYYPSDGIRRILWPGTVGGNGFPPLAGNPFHRGHLPRSAGSNRLFVVAIRVVPRERIPVSEPDGLFI